MTAEQMLAWRMTYDSKQLWAAYDAEQEEGDE